MDGAASKASSMPSSRVPKRAASKAGTGDNAKRTLRRLASGGKKDPGGTLKRAPSAGASSGPAGSQGAKTPNRAISKLSKGSRSIGRSSAASGASGSKQSSTGTGSSTGRQFTARDSKLKRRLGKSTAAYLGNGGWFAPFQSTRRWYRRWRVIIVMAALVLAILTPLRFAFLERETYDTNLWWFELSLIGLAFLDLLLSLFFVLPESRVTSSRLDIARAFVFSIEFPQEIVSALPLDMFVYLLGGSLTTQMSLGMLRLLRIRHVARFLLLVEQGTSFNYNVLILVKAALVILYLCHLFACWFWYIGERTNQPPDSTWSGIGTMDKFGVYELESFGSQYLTAIYFTTTLLVTGGYDDFNPMSQTERAVAMVVVSINYFIGVYVIGLMTNVVAEDSKPTKDYRVQFEHLLLYMHSHELPADMVNELSTFVNLQFNTKEEHAEIVSAFPPVFRARIFRILYKPIIEQSYLLDKVSDAFLDVLACELTVIVFQQDIPVVCQWDTAMELFFVINGTLKATLMKRTLDPEEEAGTMQEVDIPVKDPDDSVRKPPSVKSDKAQSVHSAGSGRETGTETGTEGEEVDDGMVEVEEKHVLTISENDVFGELAFMFDVPQPFSYVTGTVTRVLELNRASWKRVCVSSNQRNVIAIEESVQEYWVRITKEANLHQESSDVAVALNEAMHMVTSERARRNLAVVGDLCKAAETGNIHDLKKLAAGGHNVNDSDYDRRTPLHVAASRGKLESVKQLIELGGDPNRVDDFGLTPLYEAVTHGHTEVIKYLTILGADLGLRSARVWDPEGMDKRDAGTLMCQVCSEGNLKMLKALLRGGVHPDSHDYDGRTGTHIAAASGNMMMLEILLAANCHVSVKDNFGRTPLLEAVRANNAPTATMLWERGAVLGLVSATDKKASAADLLDGSEICTAVFQNKTNYLTMLLQFGIDPNACDYDRRTAAHIACAEGRLSAALILQEYGADFEFMDRWGQSATHEATVNGHLNLVGSLAFHKAWHEELLAQEAAALEISGAARAGSLGKGGVSAPGRSSVVELPQGSSNRGRVSVVAAFAAGGAGGAAAGGGRSSLVPGYRGGGSRPSVFAAEATTTGAAAQFVLKGDQLKTRTRIVPAIYVRDLSASIQEADRVKKKGTGAAAAVEEDGVEKRKRAWLNAIAAAVKKTKDGPNGEPGADSAADGSNAVLRVGAGKGGFLSLLARAVAQQKAGDPAGGPNAQAVVKLRKVSARPAGPGILTRKSGTNGIVDADGEPIRKKSGRKIVSLFAEGEMPDEAGSPEAALGPKPQAPKPRRSKVYPEPPPPAQCDGSGAEFEGVSPGRRAAWGEESVQAGGAGPAQRQEAWVLKAEGGGGSKGDSAADGAGQKPQRKKFSAGALAKALSATAAEAEADEAPPPPPQQKEPEQPKRERKKFSAGALAKALSATAAQAEADEAPPPQPPKEPEQPKRERKKFSAGALAKALTATAAQAEDDEAMAGPASGPGRSSGADASDEGRGSSSSCVQLDLARQKPLKKFGTGGGTLSRAISRENSKPKQAPDRTRNPPPKGK